MKRGPIVLAIFTILAALFPAADAAQKKKSRGPGEAESLFLDLKKMNLGTLSTEEDKQKYLNTIQLEKAKITRKTMRSVYDNAYDLYKAGDYEATRDLAAKMLSIDPGFEDAAILQRASIELKGAGRPGLSGRKLVQNRFDEAMSLYRQGRLVETSDKLEEVVKLSPMNLKARYWLKKVRGELAAEHYRRGQAAYRQNRLRETLDQWYAALVLNPRYPRLMTAISKVEAELRQSEANDKLQTALQLYSQGRSQESLKALDQVLQVDPSEPKAQRLQAEIRSEIANQHVVEGRRLYSSRKYNEAIAQWRKAVEYGYDLRAADQLIARAKEGIRREEDAKKRAKEAARQKEEEEKRKAEEAALKAEEEKRAKELAGAAATAGSSAGMATEENRRAAVQHWNAGIIYFQKGEYERARDEWLLCKQLDAANSDCLTGLQRVDQQFGGP